MAANGDRARDKEHLVSQHYPETAALLLQQASEILRRWDQRVRREIPASRSQEPLVLQNNLGALLAEVAKALSPTGQPAVTIEGLTLSQNHGGHRALLAEYSLGEMFLEYRLLRQTILEVLDEERSLPPDEREVINNALERAMQDAVSRFALVQQEVERHRGDEARRMAAELRAAYERERRIAQVLQRPLLLQVAEDAVSGLSQVAGKGYPFPAPSEPCERVSPHTAQVDPTPREGRGLDTEKPLACACRWHCGCSNTRFSTPSEPPWLRQTRWC